MEAEFAKSVKELSKLSESEISSVLVKSGISTSDKQSVVRTMKQLISVFNAQPRKDNMPRIVRGKGRRISKGALTLGIIKKLRDGLAQYEAGGDNMDQWDLDFIIGEDCHGRTIDEIRVMITK